MDNLNPNDPHLETLSQKLQALANPNRLSIVKHLQKRDMCVGALAEAIGLSPASLSHHLHKLKDAGFVTARQHQQMRYYSLTTVFTTAFPDSFQQLFN